MSAAANRYANALLDLAVSEHAVDAYQDELEAVLRIVGNESEFHDFLLNPQKNLATKKTVLENVFDRNVRENILHLLLLLLDKGRMEAFPDICSAYAEMADEYRNILTITVTSALPLDPEQIERIGEKFRVLYHGASVRMNVETDPSLIGGIKVAVGDKLYDGTVKGKLSKMRSALAGQ